MRSPARKRPVRRKWGYGDGRWQAMGPLELEGRRGVHYPRMLLVRQNGLWVLRDYRHGSRDRPKEY